MPKTAPGYIKKEFIGISVKKTTLEKLREIAEEEERSLSNVVEGLIKQALKTYVTPTGSKTLLTITKLKKGI